MRISVVIPTLGRPAMLLETLESVLACDPAPHEILVVDGDANRSAREAVNQLPGNATTAPVRCLASPRGASVQRNRGIEVATGDVVLFIDDDAIVDPGLIGVLCATYRDPEIVGVTGRIIQGDYRAFGNQRSRIRQLLMRGGRQGTMTSYGYPRHLQELDRRWDVEFMQGCLMSARRELAARVGFDTDMGGPRRTALLEDEDFSYRLSRHGRVVYVPDAVVNHRAVGFRSRQGGARSYSRLIVTDRAYLLRKNFRVTPLVALRFALLIGVFFAHRVINAEWGGILGLAEGVRDAVREARARSPRQRLAAAPAEGGAGSRGPAAQAW
ncbi:MAG: glycosyltransferase family 2 protein [Actinobacteria bacterium]|nr:MAG: glycosyltransferase family 2 protein [Actinomycetota bacterium]